jgi:hypothetical protein
MTNRLLMVVVICGVTVAGGTGCASRKSDEVLVRERLAQFDRAWREYDASGVRLAMASESPDERDLADAFASLASSRKQLDDAERRAIQQVEDQINKQIPFPLRRLVPVPKLGLKPGMLATSRWDALAKAAASAQDVKVEADPGAAPTATATASDRVTFHLRRQSKRWVIDPQTFGSRGASTVAAALRREVDGNAQMASALKAESPDQLSQVLPRVAAQRAADMVMDDDGAAAGLVEQILGAAATPAASHE